jgi:prolyl 4-hydroxylase
MAENGTTNGSGAGTPKADPANEELNKLRAPAIMGDLGAKIELGQRLLAKPRSAYEILEGAAVTVSAANDGSGEAAYRTAVLAAGAISMRRNWRTALVYCRRAAELGYVPAQEELAGLCSNRELAAQALAGGKLPPDIWARLSKSVDLNAAMTPPRMKSISINPRIATVENFLAPEVCDKLVETARDRLEPMEVVGESPVGIEVAGAMHFGAHDLTLQTILLLDRIAESVGVQHRGLEAPTVLRFAGGKDYPAHYDYLDKTDPNQRELIARNGQRAVTFLVFLNDDFSGGETNFPSLPRQFQAKKGDALFWWNINNDGTPVPETLNGNLAVTSGEKWVLSQWICVPVRLSESVQ